MVVKLEKIVSVWFLSVWCIFFLLLALPRPGGCETIVGGEIAENTIWELSSSPYHVTSSVTVNQGFTLTMEAGVQVKFDAALSITVNGGLDAIGTSTDPIVFTSSSENPAPGDWNGLQLHENSNVSFSYCDISYSNSGLFISYASPVIQHSRFIHNITGCYIYGTAMPQILDCTMENNENGMLLKAYFRTGTTDIPAPVVNACNFSNNSVCNMQVDSNDPNTYWNTSIMDARNNWWGTTDIEEIQATIIDYEDDSHRALVNWSGFLDDFDGDPVLTAPGGETYLIAGTMGNTSLNSVYLVLSRFLVQSGHTLTMDPGTTVLFESGAHVIVLGGGTLNAIGQQSDPIEFTSFSQTPASGDWNGLQLFENSNVSLSYCDISYSNSGLFISYASPMIQHSRFIHNITGCYVYGTAMPQILDCTMEDNEKGMLLKAYFRTGTTDIPAPVVNACNFSNNSVCNLQVDSNDPNAYWNTSIMDVRNNWWGTSDIEEIQATIIDYEDDSHLAMVNWSGFLDGLDGAPVLTAPGGETYLIAGTMGNTSLNGVYLVLSRFLIQSGHTLTIDPGTTVLFESGAYVLVLAGGILNAVGAQSDSITFTSFAETPAPGDWNGIQISDNADAQLSYCHVQYSNTGVYIDNSAPLLQYCNLNNNITGCDIYRVATPQVLNCTIENNEKGMLIRAYFRPGTTNIPAPVINACNFGNNSIYNMQLGSNQPETSWNTTIINAESNWWGAQSPSEISDTIWDFDDDNNLGIVDFDPWQFHIVDEDGPSMSNIRYNGVSIQSGDTVTVPASFELEASDSVSGVNRVSFYIDGILKHTHSKYSGTYSFSWNIADVEDGAHEVTMTAFDNLGNETSETLILTVAPGLPDVPAITFPADGLTTGRHTLMVTGTAPFYTTVSLYNNDVPTCGNVPVDADGNFSAMVVLSEGTNAIAAESVHRAGQSAKCEPVTVTMDPDALSPPTDFQLTAKPDGLVRLSWKPPLNNVFVGYNIYRSESEFTEKGQATKITADPVEGIIYDDTPGMEIIWYYAMTTVDSLSDESDLTDVLSVTADATPPAATDIAYTPQGSYDPGSGRMGPGDVDVRVTVSEPLMSIPFFSVRPPVGGPVSVVLSKASETEYTGTFEITGTMGAATAQATFSARDMAGNQGTVIESGDTFKIDAMGPAVIRVEINPVSPINNDTPQTVTVTIGLNEEIPDGQSPDLSCQLSGAGRNPIGMVLSKITPVGEDIQTWQGTFDLPADAGSPDTESFSFIYQGMDDLGNVSDNIADGNLFQVYQGDLPPLDPPSGLQGKAIPAGQVELTWQSVQDASGYQVYRKAPGETEWQEHQRLGEVTLFIDDTTVDGLHEYALASIRSANSQEAVSVKSDPVTVESDSVAPSPVPQNLTLTLLGAGIQADWDDPGYPETVTYNLYRSGDTQITDVSGLTPVMTGIADTVAVDANPSITDHCYAVTALDIAGNESLPSESAYLNFELLPVNTLRIVQTDSDFPIISWTHTGANITGYHVYLYVDSEWVPLNDTLITSNQFVDNGYSGPSRLYSVTAVDDNDTESVGRSLLLPEIVFSLNGGEPVHRGVMNSLEYQVENRAGQDLDDLTFHVGVETHEQQSDTFSLPDNQTDIIEVIVPGHADLPDSSSLETIFEMIPNEGETVKIVRNSTISVVDGMPTTRIYYETLVRGANSAVYFSIENTGDAPMDLVTATGYGQSASDEITFNLLDEDGNVLSSTPFLQAVGEMVSTLSNGDAVTRIPAGDIFTSEPVDLLIPESSTDNVTIQLVIEKIHYQYQSPGVLYMDGLIASKNGTIIDTSYYGQILSVDPENSKGESDIVITGEAVFRATGDPLASAPLHLVIENRGFERIFGVFTADDGMFEYTFTPGSDESGVFLVDAVHPDLDERSFDSQFVIERVTARPSALEIDLPRNYPQLLSFAVSCGSGTQVNNLHLAFDAQDQPGGVFPDGVQVVPDTGVTYMGPGETRSLSMTLTADNSSADDVDLILAVKSDETGADAWTTISITAHFSLGAPSLSFTPDHIETGLDHNEIVDAVITLQNTGSAPFSNIVLNLVNQDLSPAPEWAHMNTTSNTDILAAGESLPVNLQFSPGTAAPYARYDMILRVASAQLPMTDIPVTVTVTDSDTGNLLFKVEDVYTGRDDGQGGVIQGCEGASVYLRHDIDPSVEASLQTDAAGETLFSDLLAGNYQYRIVSGGNKMKIGRVTVLSGVTVNERVFLDPDPISVFWEVVPTQIEDRYEIVLTTNFETDVPAPVIVAEPASIHLPEMEQGQVFQGEFQMINYGLINADNVELLLPPDNEYFKYEIVDSIPDKLEPYQRVIVPYRVTCIKTPGDSAPEQRVASILSGKSSRTPQTREIEGLGCGLNIDCVVATASFECSDATHFTKHGLFCVGSTWGECRIIDLDDGKPNYISVNLSDDDKKNGGGSSLLSSAPQQMGGVACWPVQEDFEDLCEIMNNKIHAAGCWIDPYRSAYFDEAVDLSVKVPGGNIEIRRRYQRALKECKKVEVIQAARPGQASSPPDYCLVENSWFFEHFNQNKIWTNLSSATRIAKGNVEYELGDEGIYVSGEYRIETIADGFLWKDKWSNWQEFDAEGLMTSYGTTNGVLAKVVRDVEKRPESILDRNDREVFEFEYAKAGDLYPSIVRDYTGRQVGYTWHMAGLNENKLAIDTVTDPLGNTYEYTYENIESMRMVETSDYAGRETSAVWNSRESVSQIANSKGEAQYITNAYLPQTEEFYSKFIDADGMEEETCYDKDGQLKWKAQNGRRVLKVEKNGNKYTYTDAVGNVRIQKKDEWDNLIYTKHPDGSIERFEYHPVFKQLSKYTDTKGIVQTFSYDDKGNLVEKRLAVGTDVEKRVTYVYDDAGQFVSVKIHGETTDEDIVVEFAHDANGAMESFTDPMGQTMYFEQRDAMGNPGLIRDRNGHEWAMDYDDRGRMVSFADPLGNATIMEFNGVDLLKALILPSGKRFEYSYNDANLMVSSLGPGEESGRISYSPGGRLLKAEDEEGKKFSQTFDSEGHPLTLLDGMGNVTRYHYDLSGDSPVDDRPVLVEFPTHNRKITYDVRGRPVKIEDVLDENESLELLLAYDSEGNPVSVTDTTGKTVRYEYDPLYRMEKIIDPSGGEISFGYDLQNNIVSITNPENATVQFEYDKNRHLKKSIKPMGQESTFEYDGEGNPIALYDPEGQKIEYLYDIADRMTKVRQYETGDHVNPVGEISFEYNPNDLLVSIDDGSVSTAFDYDDYGRRTSAQVDFGAFELSSAHTFYKNGMPKTFTSPDGTVHTYSFDAANRLIGIHIEGVGEVAYTDFYSNYPQQQTLPGGHMAHMEYDSLRRLTSIDFKNAGEVEVFNVEYGYSTDGRLAGASTPQGDYVYQYDDLGNLTGVTNPLEDDETYTYDGAGNRLTSSRAAGDWIYNENDELISNPEASFVYDANGNMVRKNQGGNIVNYFHDVEDRLVRVEDGLGTVLATYGYDAFGRRIWKEVDGNKTWFFHSHEGLIGEYDSSGNAIRTYGYEPGAPYGARPLYQKVGTDIYWYVTDRSGTPRKMIDVNGNVVWAAHYDSFGKCHVDVNIVENPLRFPGQYEDAETGLHYNYARYYDPELGRYIQPDPALYRSGFNLYLYASNSPVSMVDPMGLCAMYDMARNMTIDTFTGAIVGALGGALAGGLATGGTAAVIPGLVAGLTGSVLSEFMWSGATQLATMVGGAAGAGIAGMAKGFTGADASGQSAGASNWYNPWSYMNGAMEGAKGGACNSLSTDPDSGMMGKFMDYSYEGAKTILTQMHKWGMPAIKETVKNTASSPSFRTTIRNFANSAIDVLRNSISRDNIGDGIVDFGKNAKGLISNLVKEALEMAIPKRSPTMDFRPFHCKDKSKKSNLDRFLDHSSRSCCR